MKRLALLGSTLLLTAACAMSPQYRLTAEPPNANRQKDGIECLALASQGAQGNGAYFSDPIMRSAMFDHARDQLFAACLQSRGYAWTTAR